MAAKSLSSDPIILRRELRDLHRNLATILKRKDGRKSVEPAGVNRTGKAEDAAGDEFETP